MTDPPDRPDRQQPEAQAEKRESLLFRVVRSAIAPDVLEDGGSDAPLSKRGQWIFRSIVAVLVIGIVVLLLVTAASH